MFNLSRKIKVLIAFFTFILTLAIKPLSVNATVNIPNTYASYAVDVKTGKVLHNQNGDKPLQVASMAKLVVLYATLDKIHNGGGNWNDVVPISGFVKSLDSYSALSNFTFNMSEKYTVKELFDAALIESSNGSAIALADYVGNGNQKAGIDKGRELLDKMGVTNYKYISASGLGNVDLGNNIYPGTSRNDANMFTARDMAIIADKMVANFPEVLDVAKIKNVVHHGQNIPTSNPILTGTPLAIKDPDIIVDGLKTGFTDEAGMCFVSTGTVKGRRVVTVVIHSDNRAERTKQIYQDIKNSWETKTIDLTGLKVVGHEKVKVARGTKDKVKTKVSGALEMVVPKGAKLEIDDLHATLAVNKGLNAPIKKGKTVGKLSVICKGDKLGYINDKPSVAIKSTHSVSEKKGSVFAETFEDLFNKTVSSK